MSVQNIPTRFALVKRAQKILKDIDDYFDDASAYGLSTIEADPDGLMRKMRNGIIAMLEREGRLKKVGYLYAPSPVTTEGPKDLG